VRVHPRTEKKIWGVIYRGKLKVHSRQSQKIFEDILLGGGDLEDGSG